MSLPLIAKHLAEHGRGEDTHLVHMTTGELKALQKMAEQHGGSLTINPHTGLPEAGFLSAVLPAVAGIATAAFAPELLPLVAGGIGVADYAMTGSLTQGLMAGLGAWGTGSLTTGLEAAGTQALTQTGGDVGNAAFDAAQKEVAAQFPTATTESVNQVAAQQALNPTNFPNIPAEQLQQMQGSVLNAANPSDIVNAAGQGNASLASNVTNPTGMQNLANAGRGLSSFGSVASSMPGATLAAVSPVLSGATSLFKQPTVPTATNTSTNPFGMKTIPKDANGNPIFNASIPAVPSPHYQATYPNYVQNPYQPTMAASGGLMDIPKYSGADYGSMVTGANEMQQGLAQATSPQQLSELQKELIAAGQENSKNGVYHLSDIEYAKMTPAALMKTHKIAVANGLQPVGQLGDYDTTPAAAIAQADIDKAAQQKTSAKEGGLMAMASGGSTDHIYHPQYQNYAQQQYQPQASSGIPVPTRPASVPAQGYKIDPLLMQGSPAYNQHQADLAAQAAAQAQIAAASGYDYGGGGGASGGLPKDFKHHHANGGVPDGHFGHLGSFSDGGRLLKGPGDGVSDGIPATIGGKQPARLADGEFVIPARIVSELGNGSTDAGAKRLYAMMDRIKHARAKAKDIAADTKAYKYLPA